MYGFAKECYHEDEVGKLLMDLGFASNGQKETKGEKE
jgi:hypothetical protein